MASETAAWRCVVCGYIHRGPEPPDECPVCGASREEFEPFVEEAAAPAARSGAKRWQCLICGCEHEGDEPPDACPVCAAGKTQFEPLGEQAPAATPAAHTNGIAVVGGGVAGVSAVEAIRAANREVPLTLLSREEELPYHRLNLTRFVAGEIDDPGDLTLHPESWYAQRNVEVMRGAEVADIRPADDVLELRTGEQLGYDKLILTAGAHPFMLPIPGVRKDGVTAFRTLPQAQYILQELDRGGKCVCVGGGILGLESAAGMAQRGADVTILEGFDWLLPRQLNQRGGQILESFVRELGIEVRPSARTKELVGDERVRACHLEDGAEIPAELVVIAVGIRTNSYLARLAGLEVNQGVVVDDCLTTSHPNILAAGDVAEHRGVVAGLWGPAQYQGTIAGMNAAGQPTDFGGIPRATTMKVVGLPLFSIGEVQAEDASYREVDDEGDDAYRRFLFRDNCLVGAILLGDLSMSAAVKKAIENRTDLSGLLRRHPSAAEVADCLR